MTRPDEIAALAERLAKLPLYSQEQLGGEFERNSTGKREPNARVALVCAESIQEIVSALRLSATSPGDAVRVTDEMVKAALISLHKNPVSWEHPNTVRAALEAALAPAEKAGNDRHPVLCEFMPLSLVPLENPNHDPGEHQVMDSDTAYVFRICGSRERAENIVACLNAYAATPTPPSADLVTKARELGWEYDETDNSVRVGVDTIASLIQSAARGGGTKSDGASS